MWRILVVLLVVLLPQTVSAQGHPGAGIPAGIPVE